MTTSWTDGYVADLSYTHGFYRELTPAILRFAMLARGLRAPSAEGPLAYCELGCGQGFSANLLAAANPRVDVHATDFNPAHITGAQALAAAAGTPNVHFYDRSFAEFVDEPGLPAFDIVALHGIYSWISPENRRIVVEFIRRHLKPGGLVYISYNTLPGWASAMPLRRLFAEHAATTGGPLAPRIDQALDFAQRVMDAGALYARANPGIKERLGQIRGQSRNYLAHEFFNRDWTPFYHADVASDLAAAKLTYAGSAHLLDHVEALNLTADQKAALAEVGDPTLRETVRDYMTNQQFRRDVFVKGAVPLSVPEMRERWLDLRFVLSTGRADLPQKVAGPSLEANLQAEVYGPVLDALAGGPKTLRRMVAEPAVQALGWPRLQQALTVLVGMGHLQPGLAAEGDGERALRTRAFNTAVMERAKASSDLLFLASPVSGGGVMVDRVVQLFLLARQTGQADPVAFAWDVFRAVDQRLVKDGRTLETAEDNLAELRARLATFTDKQLPVMQALGIA